MVRGRRRKTLLLLRQTRVNKLMWHRIDKFNKLMWHRTIVANVALATIPQHSVLFSRATFLLFVLRYSTRTPRSRYSRGMSHTTTVRNLVRGARSVSP